MQEVLQSLGTALPRQKGEEEIDKTKQAHIGKMYEKL